MNRQQQNMQAAFINVSKLKTEKEAVCRTYGSLCHALPVLIRTSGLCQTLAFFHEKASKGESTAAYKAIWSHIAHTLGQDDDELLKHVQEADTSQYLLDTRRLIDAWIYYKRFAVSLLDVEAGDVEAGEEVE